ncbi:MAG: hypothetical protein KBB94_03505 [Legionellaceae bacterium]|nr:hypothetical protein [Legionellaceae bacterium]MBP9775276.1 hypothetical protein [Legionellaceae bacterium]
MSTNRREGSNVAVQAAKGFLNLIGARQRSANRAREAPAGGSIAPLATQSEHVLSSALDETSSTQDRIVDSSSHQTEVHLERIINMILELDDGFATHINEMITTVELGQADLHAIIQRLSEHFMDALDRKMLEQASVSQAEMSAIRSELHTEFSALSNIMNNLRETAVKQDQIENLNEKLTVLMARVSDLSGHHADQEIIAHLRSDITNQNISLRESLNRFSPIFAAIIRSTSLHADELALLNTNFRQLSDRIEALSISDEQITHIQSFGEQLNVILTKISELDNGRGEINSLRSSIESIQIKLDLFKENMEQGGLQFQDALSCLSAGLTAVLENRVIASIRVNTREISALRNIFESELLSIQSNLREIQQHAVKREDITNLHRTISDYREYSSTQNERQFQEIVRKIDALQDSCISARDFEHLVEAFRGAESCQTEHMNQLLGRIRQIESTMMNNHALQNYLDHADGIRRMLVEHIDEIREDLTRQGAMQTTQFQNLVQEVTAGCVVVQRHISAECERVKSHVTTEADRVISAVQGYLQQFRNQSPTPITVSRYPSDTQPASSSQNQTHRTPRSPRNSDVPSGSYIWIEHNGNHGLRKDGIIEKHGQAFSKERSKNFISVHGLESILAKNRTPISVATLSIFRQENIERDPYVWMEENGNHRLRSDGIIVKRGQPLSTMESQKFIESHNLQSLLRNQSSNSM